MQIHNKHFRSKALAAHYPLPALTSGALTERHGREIRLERKPCALVSLGHGLLRLCGPSVELRAPRHPVRPRLQRHRSAVCQLCLPNLLFLQIVLWLVRMVHAPTRQQPMRSLCVRGVQTHCQSECFASRWTINAIVGEYYTQSFQTKTKRGNCKSHR